MLPRGLNRRSILVGPPQRHSRKWRRRSALAMLVLVLLGYAGYRYVTSPARLIAAAGSFLQGMTGGEVSIGDMEFSFFGGTHLTQVVVRAPRRFDFGPTNGPGRVVCEVAGLRLEHRPLSLLLGRFEVRRITAVRPRVHVVRRKADGLSNWQAMLSDRPAPVPGGKRQWPVLDLRRCVLRTGLVDGKEVTFAASVEADVLATPAANQAGRYLCRVQAVGPDRQVRTLDVDIDRGLVKGELPGIWISQVLPSLPAAYAKWCDILELAGQVSPESIEMDPHAGGTYTLNLSRVSLSLPIDESEFYGEQTRARRLAKLTDVSGRITFTPQRVTFDVAGRLNGGPCHVWGWIDGHDGPSAEIGYEVHLDVQRIAIPDRRDPYVVGQIAKMPWRVQKYFQQFDPTTGWVGVAGCVSRPVGPNQEAQFRGVVTIDDAEGYYDDFPYRGEHARSVIRCTDEGIFFTVLAHRAPAGTFRVEGWVRDSSRWTDVDVRVQGVNVPVDPDMVHALPPRFQRMLQHFDLYGLINCDFRLVRQGGTPRTGPAPWQWQTTVTLREVAGRYKPFNYMQHGLCGTFSAGNGVIHDIDLYALDGGSSTTIRGRADLREDQPVVDLRVRTRNRLLTPDMPSALPDAACRVIRDAGIRGRFDVDAGLTASKETGGELQCRADIDWHDGLVVPTQVPFPLRNVTGSIHADLPAARIEFHDVTARHGTATIRLDGTLQTGPVPAGRFDVAVDDLPLTVQLRDALPPAVRTWWDAFQPEGTISGRSTIDLRPTDPPAGASSARNDVWPGLSHRTTLLLRDNKFSWAAFPLPVEHVAGTVTLTDGQCDLRDMSASHAGGHISGSGRIEWNDDGTQADAVLAVRDLPLDEPLRLGVPWQLRKIWNDWQPAGRVNLDTRTLRYRSTKADGAVWDFDGSIAADLSRLAMAVDITDAEVTADGTIRIDERGNQMSGRGTLQAPKATVSRIPITAATGDWVKKANGAIRLNNFHARTLGGTLGGFLEIEPTLKGDLYGIVLMLDKGDPAQLAQVLTGSQMEGLAGTIQTELRLRGLTDQPDTRSGVVNLRMEGQGLYRLPGLFPLASVLRIPVPAEIPDHDAQRITAKVTLMADKAILDSLEMNDRSFIMQGTGLLDLPTRQADLTIVAAKPRSWPNVPLFSEMLEGTVRELVEVHGTGPISDLKFQAKTLRSLRAAIELLSSRRPAPKPPKIIRPDEAPWRGEE